MTTALSHLCDQPDDFAAAWPDTPRVYQGHDLQALFRPQDATDICADRSMWPLQVGMVRHSTISSDPPAADHPTDTLVLNGMHLAWPSLNEFCRRLEAELGHPMTANIYRTPPGEQGFDAHWDTHHVWLAQVEGSKLWRLSAPIFDAPLEHHTWKSIGFTDEQRKKALYEPDRVVRLREGEVLWIPRGWVHWGSTGHEPSMHITIGVHLLTWKWALEQLLAQIGDRSVPLRDALPPRLDIDSWPVLADRVVALAEQELHSTVGSEVAVPLRSAQHRLFNHTHH
ncbi:hypothetical protein ABIA32_002666 [Streptacidiphilus sp. MAP12-20]|uniref:JmjC domain-containing protein n=1 Tax=Streptacidiphilus sp. MAP12-20 TaxID=3156299 RepID=UPI0035167F4E